MASRYGGEADRKLKVSLADSYEHDAESTCCCGRLAGMLTVTELRRAASCQRF